MLGGSPNNARREAFLQAQRVADRRAARVAADIDARKAVADAELVVTNDDRVLCRECRDELLRGDPTQEANLAIMAVITRAYLVMCESCGFEPLTTGA